MSPRVAAVDGSASYDHVTRREQLVERSRLIEPLRQRSVRIAGACDSVPVVTTVRAALEREHAHPERARQSRHLAPDAAVADDTQRLAMQLLQVRECGPDLVLSRPDPRSLPRPAGAARGETR